MSVCHLHRYPRFYMITPVLVACNGAVPLYDPVGASENVRPYQLECLVYTYITSICWTFLLCCGIKFDMLCTSQKWWICLCTSRKSQVCYIWSWEYAMYITQEPCMLCTRGPAYYIYLNEKLAMLCTSTKSQVHSIQVWSTLRRWNIGFHDWKSICSM